MCFQDLAISRNAIVQVANTTTVGAFTIVRANPDRIALFIAKGKTSVHSVYTSIENASNGIAILSGDSAEDVALASSNTLISANYSGSINPAPTVLKMDASDYPGIISGELVISTSNSAPKGVTEVLLDPSVSKAIQELL